MCSACTTLPAHKQPAHNGCWLNCAARCFFHAAVEYSLLLALPFLVMPPPCSTQKQDRVVLGLLHPNSRHLLFFGTVGNWV